MAQTKEGALKSAAKYAGISVDEFIVRINAGFKKCSRCKEWKEIIEFGKDKTRPDGKDSACFSCRRVKEKKSTKGRASAFKGCSHSDEAKIKIGLALGEIVKKENIDPKNKEAGKDRKQTIRHRTLIILKKLKQLQVNPIDNSNN